MTIMAAEAAPAIAGEATGGATAGAVSQAGRHRKPAPGGKHRGRPSAEEATAQRKESRRETARNIGGKIPRGKIERTNYQPIILMEFVACILLTAATPIATKKDKQGLSPYAGKDIVKLGAITVLYLILAMISVGGRGPGRLAAWFGGLILLADGLYEAGNIVKDLGLISGAGAKPAPAGTSAASASEPGGILPTSTGTQPVLGEVP